MGENSNVHFEDKATMLLNYFEFIIQQISLADIKKTALRYKGTVKSAAAKCRVMLISQITKHILH